MEGQVLGGRKGSSASDPINAWQRRNLSLYGLRVNTWDKFSKGEKARSMRTHGHTIAVLLRIVVPLSASTLIVFSLKATAPALAVAS